MNAHAAQMSEDVQSDVDQAIAGAEDMLAEAARSSGARAEELRRGALDQLKALQARLKQVHAATVTKGKAAAQATDTYVHDHPWRSILAAASLGVVVGLLIGRR